MLAGAESEFEVDESTGGILTLGLAGKIFSIPEDRFVPGLGCRRGNIIALDFASIVYMFHNPSILVFIKVSWWCLSFNFNCSGIINKVVPCDDDLLRRCVQQVSYRLEVRNKT